MKYFYLEERNGKPFKVWFIEQHYGRMNQFALLTEDQAEDYIANNVASTIQARNELGI